MTLHRKSGFTLVEMMVAVGILGVVVAGAMQTFAVQNHAYTVVDETTEAQQNLRAISYLLERDLRATSFMLPEGAAACGIDRTNAADTLYVTDSEPIDPVGQTSAGLYATIASGYSAADTTQALVVNKVTLDGKAHFPNNSDFREKGGAIVFDPSTPGRGTACGIVESVPDGTHVRVDFQTHLAANTGTLAVVPAIVYSVNANANPDAPCVDPVTQKCALLRNGVTLASDVDDLQVAYFIDKNANGVVDANEYRGDGVSVDYLSRGTVAIPTDHSKLREIRFNIVVRSRTEDPTYTADGFVQSTENRGAVGGNDGFRRRVFTSTVRQRNVGYRGVQPKVF
jgi:prepilin-type N-terminal cleavage/methylation domain-containing protein